jgi:heptosyltransferase-2
MVIRLEGVAEAAVAGRAGLAGGGLGPTVVGVSPGAAYGGAKRWLPERFAEASARVAAEIGADVAVFGTPQEVPVCTQVADAVASRGLRAHSFAGRTSIAQFIEMAAACRAFLTNDSGSMHIASALGIPTVTVFGATDHVATGPTGALARIVREPVPCSPCLKRECPLGHHACMTGVTAERVALTTLDLIKAQTSGVAS